MYQILPGYAGGFVRPDIQSDGYQALIITRSSTHLLDLS